MVRTMAEIQEDPERIRVTVDVELSTVGTAAQANRIQVLEAELAEERQRRARDLALVESQRDEALGKVKGYDEDRRTERDRADQAERSLAARDHLLSEATTALRRVREAVWAGHLDRAMEHRGDPAAIAVDEVGKLADAVAFVRATTGQP